MKKLLALSIILVGVQFLQPIYLMAQASYCPANPPYTPGACASQLGNQSWAKGANSFAVGYMARAEMGNGIAMGYNAKAMGNLGVAIGQESYSSTYGYAFGIKASANVDNSFCFGRNVTNNGSNSILIGSSQNSSFPVINSLSNSISFGINVTVPTLFIQGADVPNSGFGRIGIGTTAPLQDLHISGNVLLTGRTSTLLFAEDVPANGYWGKWGIEYEDGGLNFWQPWDPGKGYNGGSNKFSLGNYVLFLKDNGNVGIGTKDPEYKFHVAGSAKVSNNFKVGSSDAPSSLEVFGWNVFNGNMTVRGTSSFTGNFTLKGDGYIDGALKVSSLKSDASSMIVADRDGNLGTAPVPVGDQMGVHVATQNIQMNNKFLTNDDRNGTNEGIFIAPTGNVGINTNVLGTVGVEDNFTVTAPANQSVTSLRVKSDQTRSAVVWATSGSKSIGLGVESNKSFIYEDNQNNPVLTIQGGRIAIGVDKNYSIPATHKLYVAGGISTEEMKVKLKQDWSDYVFAPEYKLPSLNEVELFIAGNGHLPDVPSASEVSKEGINVAEMDATLLKKIEELTLYIIEQDKRIKELEEKLK